MTVVSVTLLASLDSDGLKQKGHSTEWNLNSKPLFLVVFPWPQKDTAVWQGKLCFGCYLYPDSDVNPPRRGMSWIMSNHPLSDVGHAESSKSPRLWPAANHVRPSEHGNSCLVEDYGAGVVYQRAGLQMFPRAGTFAVHLVCRCLPHLHASCWHMRGLSTPQRSSGCTSRHMALHFRLYRGPNIISTANSRTQIKSNQNDKKQTMCKATSKVRGVNRRVAERRTMTLPASLQVITDINGLTKRQSHAELQ